MSKKTSMQTTSKRAPTVSKARFERLEASKQAMLKKARSVAEERKGMLVGVAAAGAIGYAERNYGSDRLRSMTRGVEPTLAVGIVTGLIVPMFIKGRAGQLCAEAGAAIAGVAAYKIGKGEPVYDSSFNAGGRVPFHRPR